MNDYRDPKVVLREAELLEGSPETVADWLRTHNRWSATDSADDSLEASLLARQERLIDLALARYGQCGEVLRALFDQDDEVLRAAALSNENVYKYSIHIAPFLEPDRQRDLGWIRKLSNLELRALFFNPALPENCIEDFFKMEGAWPVLCDAQRSIAIQCLVENITLQTSNFNLWDASSWDSSSMNAVHSAWEFAEKAEIAPPWPFWLGRLYSKLGIPTYIGPDPVQMAARWTTPDDEEKAKKENKKGYLTAYQTVRCGLGRLAAAQARFDKEVIQKLLLHEDVAIRCGAYLVAHLSAEQINAACKKDGALACEHLIKNEHIWRKDETRDVLEEACDKASKGEEWIISVISGFYRQRDLLTEAHPDWFEEKIWQDDEVGEKPLTESSVGEIVEQIATSPAFISLTAKVEATSKESTYRFWVLVAILVAIAFQL